MKLKFLFLMCLLLVPVVALADNSLTAAPADGYLQIGNGAELEINISYTADENFTGFQTQIALPDGLTFVENGTEYAVLAGNAASTHQISSNLTDNTLKVVCFSAQNDILTDSPLFTIKVRASEDFESGEILLTNTLFSTTANTDVRFSDATAAIEIASPFTFEYNDADMTATVTGLKSWVTEFVDPVIPDTTRKDGKVYTVTKIGDKAFFCGYDKENNILRGSLTIGNSITEIGVSAFRHCPDLTGALTLPDNLTTIGNYAFDGNSGFTGSLTLPDNLTTIGNYAFRNCSGFTGSLTISVTSIGEGAFDGCSGFTGPLTIGNNVTTIGDWAFYYCSGFSGSLTLPDNLMTIGEGVFDGCSGFTGSLTIPDNVTTIGASAFSGCSGFTGSLTIPDNVTSIGNYAFYYCSGFNGSLMIPNNVTSIGKGAFSSCSGFTGSLTISDNVTSIEDTVFFSCSGFSGSLTLPDNLTSIGSYAFFGCSGFSGSLIIPKNVTVIYSQAFQKCSWTDVKMESRNVPSVGSGAYDRKVTIRVPVGTGDDYRNAEGWSSYEKLYEFGDANIDKKLTVTDAVAVANDIIGKPNSAWDFLCADITFDETITISDATTIISAVMEYSPAETYAASRRKVSADRGRGLVAADFSLDKNGEAVVPVSLEAAGELVALQVDFAVEDGMSIEGIDLAPAVAQTHTVATRKHDDGSMRVVLFSAAGKKIDAAAPLFNVRLSGHGSTGNLGVSEAIASTPDAQEVALGYSGGNNKAITTGLEGVDAASTRVYARNGNVVVEGYAGMHVAIYDAMGRMVDSFEAAADVETRALQQGIYIVTVDNATYKVIL